MLDGNVKAYLNANTGAISSLAMIVCSDEQSSVDMKLQLICVITGSEDAMIKFIDSFGVYAVDSPAVKSYFREIVKINNGIIRYTEKLQLKGYKLNKVTHALKLENRTIKEMML